MGPTLSTENHQTNQYESNHRPMNKETLFILDWDDTLMCTSFISLKGQPLSKEEQNQILNLGNIVSIFLSQCLKYGRVIILTNSSENWVKGTSVENLGITDLVDKNIKIISTRDNYLKKGIDKKLWKQMALNEILNKYGNKIENLVCASDSEKDINIFKKFMQDNKNINIATIKFKTKPNLLTLIKELKYLKSCIGSIIGTNKNYYLLKESKEKNSEDFNFRFINLFDYIFPN